MGPDVTRHRSPLASIARTDYVNAYKKSCPKLGVTTNAVIDFIALTRPYETFDPFVRFDPELSWSKAVSGKKREKPVVASMEEQ